jgi:5-methylcytosine-specific restriction endonuclease McrA
MPLNVWQPLLLNVNVTSYMRSQYNGGAWTIGRFNSFITSTLRAGARRWQPKYDTLNRAKTEKKINEKTGRLAQHYRCSQCSNEFTAKDMEVDHILPAVDPVVGFTSWDEFINRLFCEAENLQALCRGCHKIKSSQERKIRNANK